MNQNKNVYSRSYIPGVSKPSLEARCPTMFSSNLAQYTCLKVSKVARRHWSAGSGAFNWG